MNLERFLSEALATTLTKAGVFDCKHTYKDDAGGTVELVKEKDCGNPLCPTSIEHTEDDRYLSNGWPKNTKAFSRDSAWRTEGNSTRE